ncbi:aspartate aminotransferase [Candidatus Falkowbacteria bacterium CG10_big_fil_rev_8_21_14_0_10_43_11]|uniref:Aspartate aminotransferase n=1 Tax=Candidatus Falkowbacteria bacterium CG10_big_fil_rev_8_21_14_0_10_43_11 TaxID=1974568 RepID=A0A2M6WLP0_9BACT|nr:MAG: aspartate aminotransferase [Candidatus Falkowbacteria bacterium CG10_big_fil_rev_8_21_14_0_10_43_11]
MRRFVGLLNMLKISQRANKVIASPVRKFLPLMLAAEKRGVKVFKLNVGNPNIAPPPLLLKTIKNYQPLSLDYAPSPGIREHVAAWVLYYKKLKINLKSENIIPTVGGAEAILLSVMAVTDPGDELIVFEPFYASYKGFAAMAGFKLVPVTLRVDNDFALPAAAEIEKKITRKTKAIIVINPNNPTGTVWGKKESQIIIDIANKNNLFVISDETYREIVFEQKPSSILNLPAAKNCAIVVDSASKRFSCPGARIGCIASFNNEIMAAVLKFAMIRLSAPTLEQYGLIPLLKNSTNYTEKITAEYKKRRDAVFNALQKMPGVICQKPQGAFYIIAKLPVDNAENFVKFMLMEFSYNKKTVIVTPAENFYMTPGLGRNEIRIAYVLSVKELKEAMEVLRKGLEKYKAKKQ